MDVPDSPAPRPAARLRSPIPIGVNLRVIGVTSAWWLAAARQVEAAGYVAAWSWDHFISRGRLDDAVLECWTTITAAAARTSTLRVGSFVLNVMNRHPAVLARMAATLQEQSGGRLVLGIGRGGHLVEHEVMGIPFPDVPERVERLEEAVTVLRLLWTGGPVSFEGRHYRLRDAHAFPVPVPPPPIIIGGETPAGARLAARIGDGWNAFDDTFERDLPLCLGSLADCGRSRDSFRIIAAVRPDPAAPLARFRHPVEVAERFHALGADELIVSEVGPAELPILLDAAARAGVEG
jgi:alkanesulfonate monooxygenase SsuD/methylene tetrahydromethanopterin reductase-like flavin-dependent oxidoreductase (luciferase family)